VVCEIKNVTVPQYDCECEEFCVPGKSKRSVTHDECGRRKVVYTPTCGEVRTRTRLVKRDRIEEVKSYRWVVESLCNSCADRCRAPQRDRLIAGQAVEETELPRAVQPAGHVAPSVGWGEEDSHGEPRASLLDRALDPLVDRN
jgi:hypothetical protein